MAANRGTSDIPAHGPGRNNAQTKNGALPRAAPETLWRQFSQDNHYHSLDSVAELVLPCMMAHMAKKYSAGIIGAGIAGLSAAIGLRQAGYEVSILERAPSISPIGAALSLWENAILALRELGAAERIEREAAPIQSVSIRDYHGRTILKALPAARDSSRAEPCISPHSYVAAADAAGNRRARNRHTELSDRSGLAKRP